VSSVVSSVDSNTIDRVVAWETSMKGIVQHPLLGSGPGTFALFFESNRTQTLAGEVGIFDDPHNLFLRMAVTNGLPFALGFIGLVIIAIFSGYKKLKIQQDLLTLGSMVSLVAWCVGVCFNPVPIPMFILFGIVISGLLLNFIKSEKSDFKIWYKWVGYVLAIILIICSLCLVSSEYIFGFAKRDYQVEEYASAYRLSIIAKRINPTNELYNIYRIGSEIGMGQNDKIISQDINNLTQTHSGRAATYVVASDLYNLLAHKTGNKEYLRSAIAEMDKSLAIDKNYGERYGEEALYYYELGDYGSAKTAVVKNLTLQDNDFSPWIMLARLYQIEGNKQQTIYALTQAFKLEPNIPQLEYILHLAKTQKDIKSFPIQIVARSSSLD
jgi:hypothetical protein